MKEETSEKIEGVKIRDRIGKNLLNVGVFAMEVLVLVLLGPWAFKFFLPMLTGWLIAQIANPLVRFLEKHLHIVRSHSSFGIIAGVILLIVLGCYYLVSWLFGEAGVLLERMPDYYHSLVQMLNTASLNLEYLAGRLSPEAGQKINEVTTLLTSNLGNLVGSLGGVTVGSSRNCSGQDSGPSGFLPVCTAVCLFFHCPERADACAGRKSDSGRYAQTDFHGLEKTEVRGWRLFPGAV